MSFPAVAARVRVAGSRYPGGAVRPARRAPRPSRDPTRHRPEEALLTTQSGVRVGVLAAQLCARVPGGTARYTRDLVAALATTVGSGREVYAIAPRGCSEAAALPVVVDTLPVPSRVLPLLWERGWPPAAATAGVVHAPTMLVPPVRRDVPLVVTVHDVVPWTHPETLTSRGVAFHHRMGARLARDADLVVTPTEAVASAVRRTLTPRAPVVAVLSGTPTLVVPSDAIERRSQLGVPQAYALFVGTAEPRKGLDTLVRAMARPATRGLSLVVVGPPGWGEVDVAGLAERAGVADRVLVTGRVDDPTLGALYAGAAALVMPSRAEGFGLPVVEAMSLGVPAVTSDDAALVEVGGGASLVAPVEDDEALADAIATAAAPGAERDRLVAAGRKRAAELSWDVAADRMWTLYERVGTGLTP